jgi:hypothetical protein
LLFTSNGTFCSLCLRILTVTHNGFFPRIRSINFADTCFLTSSILVNIAGFLHRITSFISRHTQSQFGRVWQWLEDRTSACRHSNHFPTLSQRQTASRFLLNQFSRHGFHSRLRKRFDTGLEDRKFACRLSNHFPDAVSTQFLSLAFPFSRHDKKSHFSHFPYGIGAFISLCPQHTRLFLCTRAHATTNSGLIHQSTRTDQHISSGLCLAVGGCCSGFRDGAFCGRCQICDDAGAARMGSCVGWMVSWLASL